MTHGCQFETGYKWKAYGASVTWNAADQSGFVAENWPAAALAKFYSNCCFIILPSFLLKDLNTETYIMKLKRPNSSQNHYEQTNAAGDIDTDNLDTTDVLDKSPPKRFAGKGKTAHPQQYQQQNSLPILRLPNPDGTSRQVGGKRVPTGIGKQPVREESTTELLSRLDSFLPQLRQANESLNQHRNDSGSGGSSLAPFGAAEPLIIDQNDDDDEESSEIQLDINKNRYARKGLIQEYHGEDQDDEEDIDEESIVSSDAESDDDEDDEDDVTVSDEFSDDDEDEGLDEEEAENDGLAVEMDIGIGLFNAPPQTPLTTTMYETSNSSYDIDLFRTKKNDDDGDTNSADILFRI